MEDNNKYIVKEPTVMIRILTSQMMKDSWARYLIGIVIFFVLVETVANMLGVIFPASYINPSQLDLPAEVLAQMPSIPFAGVIYTFVMMGTFEFGRTLYQLSMLRNGTADYPLLFEGFSMFFKTFTIYIIRTVLTAIGFVLFIVPGVFVLYYYRQAFYILADDSSKGVIECLRESRKLMQGNVFSAFKLDFSFFLLYILATLAASMMQVMVPAGALGVILFTIAGIPQYIVLGNMYINRTVYYELLIYKGFNNFKFKNERVFRENVITDPTKFPPMPPRDKE